MGCQEGWNPQRSPLGPPWLLPIEPHDPLFPAARVIVEALARWNLTAVVGGSSIVRRQAGFNAMAASFCPDGSAVNRHRDGRHVRLEAQVPAARSPISSCRATGSSRRSLIPEGQERRRR